MDNLSQICLSIPDGNARKAVRKALRGLYDRMSNQLLSTGGLAIKAGGSAVVKAGTLCKYVSKGILCTIAANTDMTALAGTVTADAFNVYVFFIGADGTIHSDMGTEGATLAAIKFPAIREGHVMIGFAIINPTGTGDFVGGTTALDDATVVPNAVYVNTVGAFDPTAAISAI